MNYNWLEKRTLRSVDQLRLWSENPRLDPEEQHIKTYDFVTDLLENDAERKDFIALIKSISQQGFMPIDPIVVWKNDDNGKYYVAEGNRRVLALKLLRNVEKAPKSIRAIVRQAAKSINTDEIAKIRVIVAPSFDDCEWYINQRHTMTNSLQRRWSRLQQQRWIAELYEKYDKDIDAVIEATQSSKGDLIATLRILKIRDIALVDSIINKLSTEEQKKVKSHRIEMTILERWFFHPKVRQNWGIIYEEEHVKFKKNINIDTFYEAYAAFLKLVINRKQPDIYPRIDTRTIDGEVENILAALPQVVFDNAQSSGNSTFNADQLLAETNEFATEQPLDEHEKAPTAPDDKVPEPVVKHNDTNRNRIVIQSGQLVTSNSKLDTLYNELKDIPVQKYPVCVAVALRVFLDISVGEYFKSHGHIEGIEMKFNNKKFEDIKLVERLKYLKQTTLKNKQKASKVIAKLITPSNEHSLDTLNDNVHGHKTHLLNRAFLVGFWDFLFPLFEEILDIKQ